jgi:hypothetical protein
LVSKLAGSNTAEAVGIFRTKNSSAHILGGEVNAVLSHVADLGHVKEYKSTVKSLFSGEIYGLFLAQ